MRRELLCAASILALTLAGAASATTWHDGDLVTYTQGDWGDIPNGTNVASLFETNYSTVYAPSFGVFQLGDPAGFRMFFGSAATVLAYLPSSGPVGALNTDVTDPSSTSAGEFGGDVAAVKLNVDFSNRRCGQSGANASLAGDPCLAGKVQGTSRFGARRAASLSK